MNPRLSRSVPWLLLTVFLTTNAGAAADPSPDVPELARLRYLAGTFETRVDAPAKSRGVAKGEWIHGGRYLRQTWDRKATTTTPAMDGTIIVTYDVLNKKYRQWSFDSTGTIFESTGVWDANSQTMTWSGSNAEFSHTWKLAFDKEGAHTWSIVLKNKAGDTVYETRGKTTPVELTGG